MGSDSQLGPLTDLLQYGILGLILLLTALGKIWWWPAVRELLDRLDRTEKKLDRHQDLYETVVIPTLKDASNAIIEVNKHLWDMSRRKDN
jgi:hypothetical protein